MEEDRTFSLVVLALITIVSLVVLVVLFAQNNTVGQVVIPAWEQVTPRPGVETDLKCINTERCSACCAQAGGYYIPRDQGICSFDPAVLELRTLGTVLSDFYGCQAK
jgi:hypothetical protein